MAKCIAHFIATMFGIIFTTVYINFAISNLNDTTYYIFSGICSFQALLNISSGILAVKNAKRAYIILLILSVIASVPVVIAALFWLAHFCGIDFIPPLQN